MQRPHQNPAVGGPGAAEQRRTLRLKTSEPAGSRGLPDSAAAVAGNDPAPPASARIADEPAAPARPGCADRYCDGNDAAAADPAPHLAAAGRRNATSRYGEGDAIGREIGRASCRERGERSGGGEW